MNVYTQIDPFRQALLAAKKEGKSVGFVPTMGALHEGHLSLIDISKTRQDITVASIFVNPTQFNDTTDFEKYPITVEADKQALIAHECNILFLPSVKEMYPDGTIASRNYELGELETLLEGRYRPGHFQGVCQVVHRLMDIVEPDTLYLGQKDYQQCLVLKKLLEILHLPTKLETVQTFREPSGLAMSSRNLRLSPEQKEKATAIHRVLQYINQNIASNSDQLLKEKATEQLLEVGFSSVDYVEIANACTLQPAEQTDKEVVALVAAFMGEVRLIDNMIIHRQLA